MIGAASNAKASQEEQENKQSAILRQAEREIEREIERDRLREVESERDQSIGSKILMFIFNGIKALWSFDLNTR